MDELISKSALLAEMELDEPDSVDENNPEINGMRREWKHWMKKIKRFPAVDAVEVVRCKDCKWLYDGMDDYCCQSHRGLVRICENSYCSYGERKENETY